MYSGYFYFGIVLVISFQCLITTGHICTNIEIDSNIPPSKGCILPNHPDHGEWRVTNNTIRQPGQRIDVGTTLNITCEPDYKLNLNHPIISCWDDNVWSRPPPECIKRCPPIHDAAYIKVVCYDRNKNEIACDEAADGASLTYECAPYYEPRENILLPRYCVDGSWNLPLPMCIPACGKEVIGTQGNYPWVAAIYIKSDEINQFVKICEGTLLSQRFVLTAAICVDSYRPYTIQRDPVKIAVGQYYSEYLNQRDPEAQYSDVNEIILHPNYKGPYSHYRYNLGLLKTKDEFRISKFVQPVCTLGLSKLPLTVNQLGKVLTWGRDTGFKLKELSIPYKEKEACMEKMISLWATLYQDSDYFCVGYDNKSNGICGPDVGSGIFFEHRGKYYIHGVYQTTQTRCKLQTNALYTNVKYFYDWITKVAFDN